MKRIIEILDPEQDITFLQIKGFLDSCSEDVTKLQCGIISNDATESESTQVSIYLYYYSKS